MDCLTNDLIPEHIKAFIRTMRSCNESLKKMNDPIYAVCRAFSSTFTTIDDGINILISLKKFFHHPKKDVRSLAVSFSVIIFKNLKQLVNNRIFFYKTLKINFPKRFKEQIACIMHFLALVRNIITTGGIDISLNQSTELDNANNYFSEIGKTLKSYKCPNHLFKCLKLDNTPPEQSR